MEPSPKLGNSESCTSLLSGGTITKDSATLQLQVLSATENPLIPDWPLEAKTLKEISPARLWKTTCQVAIALVPTFFIILGISVCPLHGKAKSSPGQVIFQSTHVASTLWPIAFAAVVGTMSRVIALHQAERGVKLGVLETIMRSQTLFNTLKTSFGLQFFNKWTAILFTIWIFSAVGSQAVLRILDLKESTGKVPVPLVYYPNTDIATLTYNTFVSWNDHAEPSRIERTMVYSAALQDPKSAALLSNDSSDSYKDYLKRINRLEAINGTRQDLWGNVRVPFLHLLPNFNESDRRSWVNVSMDQVTPFASLMGVPIRSSDDTAVGTAELQLSSSYHVLDCGPWANFSSWSESHPRINQRINTTNAWNYTSQPSSSTQMASSGTFLAVANEEAYGNLNTDTRTVIMFGSRDEFADEFGLYSGYTFCGVKTEYIDVDVECTRSRAAGPMTCVAQRARATKTSPEKSNVTALGDEWWALHGPPEMTRLGTFEQYLKDPTQVFNTSYYDHGEPKFRSIPISTFESRLALLLNTYWHVSLNTHNFVATDGLSPTSPRDVTVSPGFDEHPLADWGTTTAYRTFSAGQIYLIAPLWMTLYVAATVVLTVCTVVTIVLQSRIRAPDILGSVSTLTRDSPYVAAPPGGSGLESTERARLLRDMWVRIQDVRPGDDVGKIAFSDDKGLGARLKWDRLYE
ncbi:hypothetical protein HDK90DRAFT_186773 [Phyllosticta capitalensis]|uniref:Uncharacterized protein n=1 Tax=Phyllosticta capitalensis TaxID=121624 RepID=A0ABR1YXM3_9PEZI